MDPLRCFFSALGLLHAIYQIVYNFTTLQQSKMIILVYFRTRFTVTLGQCADSELPMLACKNTENNSKASFVTLRGWD